MNLSVASSLNPDEYLSIEEHFNGEYAIDDVQRRSKNPIDIELVKDRKRTEKVEPSIPYLTLLNLPMEKKMGRDNEG